MLVDMLIRPPMEDASKTHLLPPEARDESGFIND